MKRHATLLAIALAALFFATSTAHAVTATMGNDAADRSNADTWADFTIVDTNNPAPFDGWFEEITYFAERPGTIRFVVVQPDHTVTWVSDEIVVDASGVHTFATGSPVGVVEGSNIGVYSKGVGVISWDYDGGAEPAPFTDAGTGQPEVGEQLEYHDESRRTYSMGTSVRASSPEICKDGGWERWGYRNQGQCIASVVANERAGKS